MDETVKFVMVSWVIFLGPSLESPAAGSKAFFDGEST